MRAGRGFKGTRDPESVGARVTTNTRLNDLNLDHINRHDDSKIEVRANGLPWWGQAQIAVDTTFVSPDGACSWSSPLSGARKQQLFCACRPKARAVPNISRKVAGAFPPLTLVSDPGTCGQMRWMMTMALEPMQQNFDFCSCTRLICPNAARRCGVRFATAGWPNIGRQ